MRETPEQHLLGVARKCGRFAARGLVTGREFVNRVFDEFADTARVYPDVIPELWGAVPDSIRGEFAEAVLGASRPEFRYHCIGGRPMTEEERRRDADLRTSRVQEWAREFVRFWEGIEAQRRTRRCT